MAQKAKKFCKKYPCGTLVPAGQTYCESHKPETDYRSDRFYHSHLWTKFSRWFRADHPLCQVCLDHGVIKGADMVDHITPLRDGGAKLDLGDLQSLCNSCHGKKSIAERGRRGKRPVVYSY